MSPQAEGRPINSSVTDGTVVSGDAYRQGLEVKRRLFGAGKERPVSHGNLADDLLRLSDELVFGRVYTRPGLDLKTRSMLTVAALTVLGRDDYLRRHLQGALHVGVTPAEIKEIVGGGARQKLRRGIAGEGQHRRPSGQGGTAGRPRGGRVSTPASLWSGRLDDASGGGHAEGGRRSVELEGRLVVPSRPQIRTAEGDELVFVKVVFDVRDREALDRALDGHPDLDRQDDGSHAWFEAGGTPEFRRSLGAFVVDGGRAVLETTSTARAERGRAFLESLAGEAVRYRATSLESVEQAMARRPARPAREADEIPPEVQAEVVHAFYDRHYRGWLDTPLPALKGKTPRAAAASKTGKAQVVALLKDLESHAARDRLASRPAYDFGWMWGELGLDRLG